MMAAGTGSAPAAIIYEQDHLLQTPTAANLAKRYYDVFFSAVGLIALSPLLLLIILAIKLIDRGPVFYRQKRVGQHGVPFHIWKFRTMVPNADQNGPSVTGTGDKRITHLGRILRRTKLDELPQLWNVLRGEMSLVGPRPEVPCYVELYTAAQRTILENKPGITDLASLCFRDEESLLQNTADTDQFYIEQCLPRKLALNQHYAGQANIFKDTWIILRTVCPYRMCVLAVYALLLLVALCGASAMAAGVQQPFFAPHFLGQQLPVIVGTQLICLLSRRHYNGLLCYFSFPELRQLTLGLIEATILLLALSWLTGFRYLPANLLLINFCTSLILVGGFRVLLRLWRERTESEPASTAEAPRRVGIIGAGKLGAQLAQWFNMQKHPDRIAVAFFDDDFGKWQKLIHNVPVVGMPECLLQGWRERLDEVAIVSQGASKARLDELSAIAEKINLPAYRVEWPAPISALAGS
jgi:lipopolysaccharide/colanic/teichoic acid biosynthesis glycosyltransferase